LEQSYITGNEFCDALTKVGSSVSVDQIERWRREGLLPHPKQVGHGRGNGSHVEVPNASVAQAQEITRLYAIRRKRDWVGWQLWLRGFDVAERYWHEPLGIARNAILDTRRAAQRYERSALAAKIDPDTLKSHALPAVRNTPLYAPLAKIRAEYVETLGGFLIDIVLGRFAGFSREGNSQPNQEERDAVLAVMGANTAASRRIADFAGSIESVLQDIAKAFRTIARRNSLTEPPVEARHEFLAAMEIGTSLYWITKAILKPKALDTFNRIAADREITTQAVMLLGWAEYRNTGNTKLPLSEIDEMRNLAVELASITARLTTKI
jgi:hypothetical protein